MNELQTLEPDEKIISMVNFRDTLVVATDRGVCMLRDNKLRKIEFERGEPIVCEVKEFYKSRIFDVDKS